MNPIVSLPEPLTLGLHALVVIARIPGKYITARVLAATLGTTEANLSKVLQRMVKGGLIKSVRGPGGGYTLKCKPEDTQLYVIFELLGGPFEPRGCDLAGCMGRECFIGGMIDELTEALLRYLKSRTLKDLTNHYEGSIPVDIDILVTTPSRKRRNFSELN